MWRHTTWHSLYNGDHVAWRHTTWHTSHKCIWHRSWLKRLKSKNFYFEIKSMSYAFCFQVNMKSFWREPHEPWTMSCVFKNDYDMKIKWVWYEIKMSMKWKQNEYDMNIKWVWHENKMDMTWKNIDWRKNSLSLLSHHRVHNEHGCLIATDAGKAAVVANYLDQQLTGDDAPLEPFIGPPRSLASPFACNEIGAAARSLKNVRANGPDGIPNELLRYH